MNYRRQKLIEHLTRTLEILKNPEVPTDSIEEEFYFGYLSPRHLIDRLSELEEQLYRLRLAVHEKPARCALAGSQGDYTELLVGASGKLAKAQKHIKKKAYSNDLLIICDPYFFQWSGPNRVYKTENDYIDFIASLVPPHLKKLELFLLPGPNSGIQKKFNQRIKSQGTKILCHETTEIHDRVIIRDNDTATLMGTSFGGYGNKLSFVLEIPSDDLAEFMCELDRIRSKLPPDQPAA
ncbi:hypothetical protein LOY38_10365 [Pseudomonas sp. B21-015]|uniref:hypothetical protein n=1 Tax=Pseudomonas sp. B21-015 TaxID=2895473 RepID=UPI002160DB82|nr:hypothetical protein [Pseudomonas sp. B21-015]UVM52404.1 hypothetical protein LOY38_10365 [Pseudomonas sp. B21-015]